METSRTKAPTKNSLTITVGGFFISTLRTHSSLTMNKTKKRAYKRSNVTATMKTFWEKFHKTQSPLERHQLFRKLIGCSSRDATEALVKWVREGVICPQYIYDHGYVGKEPAPASWDSAPLVDDTDDDEILF